MYDALARWWPLLSPVEEYADEAAELAELLDGAETVLELGAGGGHNAFHLKDHYRLTLVDRAPAMLAMSRLLNPECAHLEGDMFTLRLGRTFDAVLVHDAIDYATTEAELAAVIATAHAHLPPGGVVLLVPDHLVESFAPGTEHGGSDDEDGSGARYLQWSYDPDPTDTTVVTQYVIVTREADGTTAVHPETHVTGLFPRETWLRLLEAGGFTAEAIEERTDEPRTPRVLFRGTRR